MGEPECCGSPPKRVHSTVNNIPSKYSGTTKVVPAYDVVDKGTSALYTIDVNTGAILWQTDLKKADFGAATVLGDLVFTATYNGEVLALGRKTGQQVWSWRHRMGLTALCPLLVTRCSFPLVWAKIRCS